MIGVITCHLRGEIGDGRVKYNTSNPSLFFFWVQDDLKLLDDGGEIPKPSKKEVGNIILGCEISSLLDINLPSDQLPHVL